MTLTELTENTRYALDNRSGITTARLTQWINWALLHVTQPHIYRHIELLEDGPGATMVAGTTNYAVPTRLIAPYQVKVQQGSGGTFYRWLENTTPETFDQWQSFPTPEGTPAYYTYGPTRAVRIYPAPDSTWAGGAVQVRGWMRPSLFEVSVPDGVSPIAEMWDEVLVVGATARGWRSLNVPDRAEVAIQDFATLVSDVTPVMKLAGERGMRMSVDPQATGGYGRRGM
jgi:hypothetical protein